MQNERGNPSPTLCAFTAATVHLQWNLCVLLRTQVLAIERAETLHTRLVKHSPPWQKQEATGFERTGAGVQ